MSRIPPNRVPWKIGYVILVGVFECCLLALSARFTWNESHVHTAFERCQYCKGVLACSGLLWRTFRNLVLCFNRRRVLVTSGRV
jgi:hypothetical protein